MLGSFSRATIAAGLVLSACSGDKAISPERAVTAIAMTGTSVFKNLDVVAHDASGRVIGHQVTDASGRAVFGFDGPGMISFIRDTVDGVTVMGVQPGDTVHYGLRSTFGAGAPIARADIFLPDPIDRVPFYHVYSGCDGGEVLDITAAVPFDLAHKCIHDDLFDVVAYASNERERIAYAAARDVTIDRMNTKTLTLPEWQTDLAEYRVVLTNAGEDGARVNVTHTLYSGNAVFPGQQKLISIGAGGDGVAVFRHAPNLGERANIQATAQLGEQVFDREYSLIERNGGAPTATVTFDLAGGFLPHIIDVGLQPGEPSRPAIGWATEGSSAGADGLAIEISWGRWAWAIAAAPDTPSPIIFPEIPAEFIGAQPQSVTRLVVGLVDFGSFSGWDEFRSRAAEQRDLDVEEFVRASASGL